MKYSVYFNGNLAKFPDTEGIAKYWSCATYPSFESAKKYAEIFIGTLLYKLPVGWNGKPYEYRKGSTIEIREEN